jgi:GNAT superfamily N-acetyltransferase
MTSGALEIRPAQRSELDAVAALRFRWRAGERGERGLDAASFESAFKDWATDRASHTPFVAWRDGVAVGMAWLVVVNRVPGPEVFRRRSGNIQSVYVLPEERGQGVGTQLIERCIAEARSQGLEYLTLHHTELSEPLYRRLGFHAPIRYLELRLDGRE